MKEKDTYPGEFLSVMQNIAGDKKLLNAFLIDLLTPREYNDITVRWQIVKRLYKGAPQREIAKDLGVSVATITRGSRELLDKKGGFRQVLDRYGTKS